jgi:hypothetical protein
MTASQQGVEHDHSGNNKVAMYGKVLARDIDDALWQYAAQCEWLLHNHPRGQQWQVRSTTHLFLIFLRHSLPSSSVSRQPNCEHSSTRSQRRRSLRNFGDCCILNCLKRNCLRLSKRYLITPKHP